MTLEYHQQHYYQHHHRCHHDHQYLQKYQKNHTPPGIRANCPGELLHDPLSPFTTLFVNQHHDGPPSPITHEDEAVVRRLFQLDDGQRSPGRMSMKGGKSALLH